MLQGPHTPGVLIVWIRGSAVTAAMEGTRSNTPLSTHACRWAWYHANITSTLQYDIASSIIAISTQTKNLKR
jgi:hypothetical protein